MKAWRAIKTGLKGLAAITLTYIAGGCSTGETLKDFPEYFNKYVPSLILYFPRRFYEKENVSLQ